MMRNRMRLTTVFAVVATIVFAPRAFLSSQTHVELVRAAMFILSVGVCSGFFPLALYAFNWRHRLDDTDIASLGWFFVTLGVTSWTGWYLIWTRIGRPEWWFTDYMLAGFGYSTILGLTLVLLVASAHNGIIAPRILVSFGMRVSVATAGLIGTLALIDYIF